MLRRALNWASAFFLQRKEQLTLSHTTEYFFCKKLSLLQHWLIIRLLSVADLLHLWQILSKKGELLNNYWHLWGRLDWLTLIFMNLKTLTSLTSCINKWGPVCYGVRDSVRDSERGERLSQSNNNQWAVSNEKLVISVLPVVNNQLECWWNVVSIVTDNMLSATCSVPHHAANSKSSASPSLTTHAISHAVSHKVKR